MKKMKKPNALLALVLAVLLILSLAGCAKEKTDPQKETVASTEAQEITAATEKETPKTGIEMYFEKCAALSEESGKPMRTSPDVWSEEDLGNSQVKYTSLGGTIVNAVVYDKDREKVISVSSSGDSGSYADEEIRGTMIANVSVLAAVMAGAQRDKLDRFSAGFESVVESGIEMYQDDIKLSLSADEKNITMTADVSK